MTAIVSQSTEPKTESRAASRLGVGALLAAIGASACCWLPLALVSLGVGAGGVAAAFETLRPVFLAVTFGLLGVGFWYAYRTPRAASTEGAATDAHDCCAAEEAGSAGASCPLPTSPERKRMRLMLWVMTAAAVLFATFPYYSGLLFAAAPPPAVVAGGTQSVIHVDGMTCAGCSAHIREELLQVPGVVDAAADHETGRVTVTFGAGAATGDDALRAAVEKAGYRPTTIERRPGS